VIETSSFRSIRDTSLLRYGLVLTVPALLALSALSASPASAATGVAHPSAPRYVTARAGDNSAIVSFVAPASSGGSRITGYYVKEYGINSAIRRCNSTRCTVLGLSNGVGYRFVVAAINRFGRSAYSTPSNDATPTAPVGTTSTITFDANGGSGAMASEPERYNTTVALTLNTFAYSGYTFNDWNSEANGSGTSFTNGQLVKFNGSATFYAQWTVVAPPTTTTITFNANGGVGIMSPETQTLNVSAAVTMNTFTRTGYTFTGWNTNANGSGTGFTDGGLVQFTASATFYAQWTLVPTAIPFTGTVSSNWSGYVLPTSTIVTYASGQWTIPTLKCADTPNSNSSTWVGTGGETWTSGGWSGSLLQTGIEDDCVNGVQQDSGWWEIVPATPNNEHTFTSFPVGPGDSILAEVYQATSGQWVTIVKDLTTGLQGIMETGGSWYVTTIANSTLIGGIQGDASGYQYAGGYTAEWIQEDVTNTTAGSLFPLANFGAVTFTNLETSLSSWFLPNSDAWEIMNSSNVPVSVPSTVSNNGFTVNYTGP
jgi:uncharacterized repeat protein (TIGR02543 family)